MPINRCWRRRSGTLRSLRRRSISYSPNTGARRVGDHQRERVRQVLKTAEPSKVITDSVYARVAPELGENVSRTEVLFNGVGRSSNPGRIRKSRSKFLIATRTEWGNLIEFNPDLTSGPLVVRRGSWDLLPDGSCCTPKKWLTLKPAPLDPTVRVARCKLLAKP